MLRTEIIDVPKEAMKCDWDDEDNLENELEYLLVGPTRYSGPVSRTLEILITPPY
jgi:hypothetical protein